MWKADLMLIFCRKPNGTNSPVGYLSCSLNNAEFAYYTTPPEFLAVVCAVLLLGPYVEGFQITVRTNHDAFCSIENLMDLTGKLERWHLRSSEFNFYIVHCAANKQQEADNSKKAVRLPALYATTTFTEPQMEERQMIASEFICKQAKARILDRPHVLLVHLDLHISLTKIGF